MIEKQSDSLLHNVLGVFSGLFAICAIVSLVVEFIFVVASIVFSFSSMLFFGVHGCIVKNIISSLMYGGIASGIIVVVVISSSIVGIAKSMAKKDNET